MRTAKFNALRVAEISVNLAEQPPKISAKAAFVNTETGTTHGWTQSGSGWSNDTVVKLRELRELMERDMADLHFADGSVTTTATTSSGGLRENFKGLGETLRAGEEEVPQG